MTGNISNEVQKIPNNFPYIGVATGDDSLSFYLVVERTVLFSSSSFLKVLKGLIAAYYTFDIQYPQSLSLPLIFLQHFLWPVGPSL